MFSQIKNNGLLSLCVCKRKWPGSVKTFCFVKDEKAPLRVCERNRYAHVFLSTRCTLNSACPQTSPTRLVSTDFIMIFYITGILIIIVMKYNALFLLRVWLKDKLKPQRGYSSS